MAVVPDADAAEPSLAVWSPPSIDRIRHRSPAGRPARWHVAAVTALVVLAASACGADGPAEGGPPPSVPEQTPPGDAETPVDSQSSQEEPAADIEGPAEPGAEEAQPEEARPEEGGAGDVAVAMPEVAAVRFVSQNILHGAGCPAGSDSCRVGERVSLFMEQLAQAGCPELVSLQEANERIVGLVAGEASACGYEVVWDGDPGLDREVVLTTLELIGSRRRVLADRFRSAYLVRIASPIGVIDFLTTHLASGDDRACNPGLCPPPCDPEGSLRTCQARQVLQFADDVAVSGGVTVVGGDLNDWAGSRAVALFAETGFVDSHLAAGHGECDPASGASCTAGRQDESLADLGDPAGRQSSRIDYLLYSAPGRDCAVGQGTGLFKAEPATGELAFPSDHTGVALTLVCDAAGADPIDPAALALPEEPDEPAPADGLPVDAVTAEAIAAAFEIYLDGSVADIELRIDQVEDFTGMRQAARQVFEQVGEAGAAVRARVDSISRTSSTTARVVYSILLNDQVVFDGRVGEAVLTDGRWLVSKATFCDLVALSGAAEALTVC